MTHPSSPSSGTDPDTSMPLSAAPSKRNPYEQQEFQRKNPQLFTALTECVNPDGTITTFDQVTSKLQTSLKRLDEVHTKRFGGSHPVYCLRPIFGQPEDTVCQAIEFHQDEMDKVRATFVRNYAYIHERSQELSQRLSKTNSQPGGSQERSRAATENGEG